MSCNRFELVNTVAARVRQQYGERYNVKRAQLSEVVKLMAELSDLKADGRKTFSSNTESGLRVDEIERRLAVIQAERQPSLKKLFEGVMRG